MEIPVDAAIYRDFFSFFNKRAPGQYARDS